MSNTTDWIQAIGSVIAAVGLLWTLILQKKATDAQVRATEDQIAINAVQLQIANRDYERYLQEIMPTVHFEFHYDSNEKAGSVIMIMKDNPAYEFSFENLSENLLIFDRDSTKPRGFNSNTTVHAYFKLNNALYTLNEIDFQNEIIILKVQFKDKIGNMYSQKISKRFRYKDFYHAIPLRLSQLTIPPGTPSAIPKGN